MVTADYVTFKTLRGNGAAPQSSPITLSNCCAHGNLAWVGGKPYVARYIYVSLADWLGLLGGAQGRMDGQHFLDWSARRSGFNARDAFTPLWMPPTVDQSTGVKRNIVRSSIPFSLAFNYFILILSLSFLLLSYFHSLFYSPLRTVAAIGSHVRVLLFFFIHLLNCKSFEVLKMVRVSFHRIQFVWLLRKRLRENSNLIIYFSVVPIEKPLKVENMEFSWVKFSNETLLSVFCAFLGNEGSLFLEFSTVSTTTHWFYCDFFFEFDVLWIGIAGWAPNLSKEQNRLA